MMINLQRILKKRTRLLSICIFVSVLIPGCATQMENKSSSETGQLKKSKVIHSLTTDQSENSFNIHIEGSDNLAFTSVKQPFPTGVILYFPNTVLKNIQSDVKFSSCIVEAIKSTEYKQNSHTARIEILLRKDVRYKVSKEKKGLLISFIRNETLNANVDLTGSIDDNNSNKISPLQTTLSSSETSKLEEIQNTYDQSNVKSEKLPIPAKYGESDVKSNELPIPVKMVAASDVKDVKTDEVIEILTFSLLKEEFAFKISQLAEIVRPQKITIVPQLPKYVLGVTSLRGKVIPVLDLKLKLSLTDKPSEHNAKEKILIIKGLKGPIGATIDKVIGVVRVGSCASRRLGGLG